MLMRIIIKYVWHKVRGRDLSDWQLQKPHLNHLHTCIGLYTNIGLHVWHTSTRIKFESFYINISYACMTCMLEKHTCLKAALQLHPMQVESTATSDARQFDIKQLLHGYTCMRIQTCWKITECMLYMHVRVKVAWVIGMCAVQAWFLGLSVRQVPPSTCMSYINVH